MTLTDEALGGPEKREGPWSIWWRRFIPMERLQERTKLAPDILHSPWIVLSLATHAQRGPS